MDKNRLRTTTAIRNAGKSAKTKDETYNNGQCKTERLVCKIRYYSCTKPFPTANLFQLTTPKTKPQSFLYLSSRNQYDAKGSPSLFFIDRNHCCWAVQVYDQNREHVL